MTVDAVILAVGITGNVEDIGLETTRRAGREGAHRRRPVAGHRRAGPLRDRRRRRAALAGAQGEPRGRHLRRAASPASPDARPLDPQTIPACTYCRPQIASVGLTEAAARASRARAARRPLPLSGERQGDRDRRAGGRGEDDLRRGHRRAARRAPVRRRGHRARSRASSSPRPWRAPRAELMRVVFPHPTLSEMLGEATLDAFGRVLHT